MATQVLLCSETFVRSNCSIDDNINSKLLNGALREAQEINLREILGDNLIDKVIDLVRTGTVDQESNIWYKKLIIESQYFLAYSAVSNICLATAVKISNAGLEQVSDEHLNPIGIDDSFRIQTFYRNKADFYCLRLQNFILSNRQKFPELTTSHIHKINSNLYSSATTGLWLGGARGRKFFGRLRDKYNDR